MVANVKAVVGSVDDVGVFEETVVFESLDQSCDHDIDGSFVFETMIVVVITNFDFGFVQLWQSRYPRRATDVDYISSQRFGAEGVITYLGTSGLKFGTLGAIRSENAPLNSMGAGGGPEPLAS